MRSLGSFGRNFSIVAAAQAITLSATFVFTLAQARYLDLTRFGELSIALSATAILTLVVDFGLSTKVARDVAQRPAAAGKTLAATLVVRFGLWCLAMPLVWAGTVILNYNSELRSSILILGVGALFGGIAASLAAYFQGREEFLFPSLGSIAQRGSAALLGVGALALGHGVLVVAGVYVVASVLQVLVMLPGMRRYPTSMALERATIVKMMRGTATLGFFWMLGAFYYNIDLLILQRLVPPENVAWYAAAYRLFGVALAVVGAASSTVLYPVMARLAVGSRDELRFAIERSFTFFLASGVFVALIIGFEADQVVALVFPTRAYGEAANALRLLAPGIVAIYANGPFFITLLGMGLERRLLVMAAVLAVLNPLANFALIPLLQQNGSALLTSATEAIVLVWVLALTPKELRGAANPRVIVRLFLAATPAAACLWLLRDWSMFIGIPVAGLAYAMAALALGAIPANDLRAIRTLLARTRHAVGPDGLPAVAAGTAER